MADTSARTVKAIRNWVVLVPYLEKEVKGMRVVIIMNNFPALPSL